MPKTTLVLSGVMLVLAVLLTVFLSRVQAGQVHAPMAPIPTLTPPPFDNTNNNLPTAAPNPAPTPVRVIDLAPLVPDREKAYLWIQHPDGSRDEVRLTGEMIADYLQRLPSGDRLVAEAPPLALQAVHPPDPSAGPIFETVPPGTPSPNPPTAEASTPLPAIPAPYPPPGP
jgi:hypothetical protein